MFGKKETEVKELFLNHISSIEKSLKALDDALKCYLNKDIKCARDIGFAVHTAEGEADVYRRKIIKKLYSGAFLPVIREDLIRFIAHQDKIADRAESCCDFCMTQKPRIPSELNPKIIELIDKSLATFLPYAEAVTMLMDKNSDYEAIKKKLIEVNSAEEVADTIEWHLIDAIFDSELTLAEKMHINQFVFHIVTISDVIEDAADEIDLIMVKQHI